LIILIMHFSPISCYFLACRSEYLSEHPLVQHPVSLMWEIKFHALIKQAVL
jgi:hypothetical protein